MKLSPAYIYALVRYFNGETLVERDMRAILERLRELDSSNVEFAKEMASGSQVDADLEGKDEVRVSRASAVRGGKR